jgi:hypothetical protein
MADIYENAYVTIAATSASDSTKGFLSPRTVNMRTYRLPAWFPNHDDGSQPRILAVWHEYHTTNDPLYTRAWCFQEWILPKRLLSFGKNDVQFLCQEQWKCECAHRKAFLNAPEEVRKGVFQALKESNEVPAVYRKWKEMVSNYQSRYITHHTDRLMAVAGISKKFQQFLKNDVYFAGLWQGDLLDQLSWVAQRYNERDAERADNFTTITERADATESCFPSWSWASVEYPIDWKRTYDAGEDTRLSTDLEFEAVCWSLERPSGPDTGPAYIQLSGPLKLAYLVFDPSSVKGDIYPFPPDIATPLQNNDLGPKWQALEFSRLPMKQPLNGEFRTYTRFEADGNLCTASYDVGDSTVTTTVRGKSSSRKFGTPIHLLELFRYSGKMRNYTNASDSGSEDHDWSNSWNSIYRRYLVLGHAGTNTLSPPNIVAPRFSGQVFDSATMIPVYQRIGVFSVEIEKRPGFDPVPELTTERIQRIWII